MSIMKLYFHLERINPLLKLIFTVVFFGQTAAAQSIEDAAAALNARIATHTNCPADTIVGMFPPEIENLPITAAAADILYEGLIAALLDTAPPCTQYIDGLGANVTLEYLANAGMFRESGQQHRETINRALADADIQLHTRFSVTGAGITLLLRATEMRAGIAIASASADIPEDLQRDSCGSSAQPLGETIERIGRRLANRTGDLTALVTSGAYFGSGDGQTELGRYLLHQAVNALSENVEDVLTGRRLSVYQQADNADEGFHATSGDVRTATADLQDAISLPGGLSPDTPGLYRLHLRYWLCEDEESAQVTVSLSSPSGVGFSEVATVRLDAVPIDIEMSSVSVDAEGRWSQVSPLRFEMVTEAGENPILRPGDTLSLAFWLSQDAWVYCFFTDSAGTVQQILPHPAQSASPPNFYEAEVIHIFPDPAREHRLHGRLRIQNNTVGEEVVTCFATSRDVGPDLPVDLRGVTGMPISSAESIRLTQTFENLTDTHLAITTATVTVLEE